MKRELGGFGEEGVPDKRLSWGDRRLMVKSRSFPFNSRYYGATNDASSVFSKKDLRGQQICKTFNNFGNLKDKLFENFIDFQRLSKVFQEDKDF